VGFNVQLLQTVNALQNTKLKGPLLGGRLALVPTMGALHEGHMALVTEAKRRADRVVVSIFVNPTQFGPTEDLEAYPRPVDADIAKLSATGVDFLWMPSVAEMYPTGFATRVAVAGLPDQLCGAARPGHFDGVTTVVSKLFCQIRPDCAIFGEKDWQQLAIIRRMVIDLEFGIDVVGVPTLRDHDGLAMSSRNAYLTVDERRAAARFPNALKGAVSALQDGQAVEPTLETARASILAGGFSSLDYVALVDPLSLLPKKNLLSPGRLIAAARIGKTRLIDNFAVDPI
jgi:pantoate--beta-alanine ligase